jgi:hypothetical protein
MHALLLTDQHSCVRARAGRAGGLHGGMRRVYNLARIGRICRLVRIRHRLLPARLSFTSHRAVSFTPSRPHPLVHTISCTPSRPHPLVHTLSCTPSRSHPLVHTLSSTPSRPHPLVHTLSFTPSRALRAHRYETMMYLLRGSTRAGSVAPALWGPWSVSDAPDWGDEMTLECGRRDSNRRGGLWCCKLRREAP